jgi:TPR repeat protein
MRKAAEAKKAEEEREAAEAARQAEEARRLAEAKAAEEARKAEAARKAADKTETAPMTSPVAPSKAEERGAQAAEKDAERGVPRPSLGSQPALDASVKPEPKVASIPDRPGAPAEVTASQAPLTAERERLAKMIARGEHELEAGNVSIARQFFLRAAEGGLARGALLLAWTYDKNEYARLRIQGVTPNGELANKWYQQARELEAVDKTEAR